MKFIRFVLFLVFPFYLISCRTQRIPNYLQHVTDSTVKVDVLVPELKIQKNDILSIRVYSASTKPEVSDVLYNLPSREMGQSSSEGSSGSGFLVDVNGNIEYPRIGFLHVEGLTRLQLADSIKMKINEKDSVLSNPSVIVRFQGLKVTLMGEVGRQGTISIPGERVTILEAIGLAGGTTEFGLKTSIKVMREIDGKREIGLVDISSPDIFSSPYYNLMQNDVVVVDPHKRKIKRQEQGEAMRQVSYALTLISAVALLYNIFK